MAETYLRAAFAIAGTSSNARRARLDGLSLLETQPYLDVCSGEHRKMVDALSSLRLIAPADLIGAPKRFMTRRMA
ncbi:hypothetical protein LG324_03000 [Phycicoccus jejuensis]|uniref:hypothetical protein n=1 Tax=Phycicoccus jejuensis TaxID=367299 RepID=UPI00384D07BD